MHRGRVWKKLRPGEINDRVHAALDKNINFHEQVIFGVPASHLDGNVFYSNAPFLADAPFLTSMVANPNHIGCHTLGSSEPFFAGTQAIENELIRICAEDIFKGKPNEHDGYVASGGTEANIQAIWMHRNHFMKAYGASVNEIGIICSSDTHYSVYKAVNLLQIKSGILPVDEHTRKISSSEINQKVEQLQQEGVKYFITIANMMTTMFGSVDSVHAYTDVFKSKNLPFRIHIDAAFGGFIFPFSMEQETELTFKNNDVHSITLDAHKMVQAPYGTGIFITRKGMINDVLTDEAQYVKGMDSTLSGSRSGANAVAVWMILSTYGPHGWNEKINTLVRRAAWLSKRLTELGFDHYRHEGSNIVTIKAKGFPIHIMEKFGLVPDNHSNPNWFKIVIMEHVTVESMEPFIHQLEEQLV